MRNVIARTVLSLLLAAVIVVTAPASWWLLLFDPPSRWLVQKLKDLSSIPE